MFISYAQNFEDVMLWRALGQETNGFYIDIGAQDPVIHSVSLTFYERGWRGVHVEPSPMYAEKLRQARPDETVIQVAIDANGSLIKLYEFPETGLSTGEAEIARKQQAAGYTLREIEVPTLTLASLLDRYADREIHWLKIDVEGMENRVIESWKPSKVRPWILVVESTYPMTQSQTHKIWEPMLFSLGYAFVYFDGLNRFYVSKALKGIKKIKKAFLTAPNIFDGFSLTANADFCRVIQERHRSELSDMRLEFEKQAESSQQMIEHLSQVINTQEQSQAEQARMHAEREQSLTTQLQSAREEQLRIEQEGAARERDLTQTVIQTKRDLEGLMRHVAAKEKEFGEKEQEWAQAEKTLNQKIADLQSEIQAKNHAQQLQAQQHGFELTTKQGELNRLRQTFADLEGQLKTQVLSEQQTSLQLRQKIAEVEMNLTRMQASLSWRMTAPLRKISFFMHFRKDPGQSSTSAEQVEPPRVIKAIAPESQLPDIQQVSIEPSMPHFAQDTHSNTPTVAATLDELLAHHDQAFIYCAYRTLLGRDPDEEGLRYYLARLRTGISKMHILSQVWRSEEARDYAAKLPRFGSVIRRYRWTQKPIIGWLVRPFSRVESNSSTEQKLWGLESQLFPLVEEDNLNLNVPVAASLDDLLAHQNQAFIFCAYRTLLGRDPDEEGLRYYLARLQTGISYMHILGQIWRSEEARDYAGRLRRFASSIRRYRWAQTPIIGWLVRPFAKVEGNSSTERKLRVLENQLFLLSEENYHHFDQAEKAILELHYLLTDQLEQITMVIMTNDDKAQSKGDIPYPPRSGQIKPSDLFGSHTAEIFAAIKDAISNASGYGL